MINLLSELKDHLKVTWDDEDISLIRLLKSGEAYFNKITGGEVDFTNNEDNKTLLFNYCSYSRANSLEYFKVNYQSEIIALQLEEGIKHNEANKKDCEPYI